MNKKLLSACLLSSVLFAVGCGATEEGESDVEGCEHLQKGPAVAVAAVITGTPAAVGNDHKRYDISLASSAEGNTGSVSFAASEAVDYVFFLSADVPLKIFRGNQQIPIQESTKSSTQCTDIKGRHEATLGVGTHTLTFGPTNLTSVSLVIEESAHDHDH